MSSEKHRGEGAVSNDVFKRLSAIDVGEHLDKKGKFSYLSWSDAVTYLLSAFPGATWEIKKTHGADGEQPFYKTQHGVFVEVSVTVEGVTRTQVHPVLNHSNKPIENPNAFDINTSIQRCLAKAIALHGLGLYVYRGEDLPDVPQEQSPAAGRAKSSGAPAGDYTELGTPDTGPPPTGCSWEDDVSGACKTCGWEIAPGEWALVHTKTGMMQCETCGRATCSKG